MKKSFPNAIFIKGTSQLKFQIDKSITAKFLLRLILSREILKFDKITYFKANENRLVFFVILKTFN